MASALGLLCGFVLLERGPAQALELILVPGLVVAVLRTPWVALAGVVGVVCLLPYIVLPVGTSVTPTLLELALLTTLTLIGAVTLLDRRSRIELGLPQAMVIMLVGVSVFAFLLGLGRGYTTQTAHDFFKFVLGIATFWVVMQMVTTIADIERLTLLLTGGVALSAGAGLLLYAGGVALTERVLVRLVPYGYPGSRIARFIEDDPARAMRAVGTRSIPTRTVGY